MNTYYTEQKIIDEIYSRMAKHVADGLRKQQLISHEEHLAFERINHTSFPSLYAEIAPKILDIPGKQSDV
ncbi:hypothetical protein [Alloscardovia omnicolens]|uniref:hypothetical protein n=1 Tax=Alloscardovia omnicolens TaxID=419015 RepID=UPI003A77AE7F